MERFKSSDSRERYTELAGLISHTLKLSPADLYDQAVLHYSEDDSKNLSSLGTAIGFVAHSDYVRVKGEHVEEGEAFLGPAIDDIVKIADLIAKKYPDLGEEGLLGVMSHPTTIDSVALLALRPEWHMGPYIRNELRHTGSINESGGFVIEDKSLDFSDYLEQSLGCPAAGKLDRSQQTGRVAPTGVFRKLVPWAAKLYLTAKTRSNE